MDVETVNTPETSDIFVFFRMPPIEVLQQLIEQKRIHKSVFYQWEPPVVDEVDSAENLKAFAPMFSIVKCWNGDLVDNVKFFKHCYPQKGLGASLPTVPFCKRKLLTNVSGNKTVHRANPNRKNELYSKRVEFIRFMEKNHPDDFEFFGIYWDKNDFPSYGGAVEDKIKTIENFKFSLCFENMKNISGYVTEKIFDCFRANTVPIYWGAENINDIIPKECYIDFRDFDGYEAVYKYIKNMPEEKYMQYINAKNDFLNSAQCYPFSAEAFSDDFAEILNKLSAVSCQDFDYSLCKKAFRQYKKFLKDYKKRRRLTPNEIICILKNKAKAIFK